MYLSKIMISGVGSRNPYEIHRVLWTLFPEDPDASRDFLFRVGHSDRNHAEILMQSHRKPAQSTVDAMILGCREYSLSFKTGQRLRFLLIANPIKTIDDETGRKNTDGEIKKCRVPLVREEEQRNWLERKFKEIASLETLLIEPVAQLRFRKGKENRVGKIQPVSFQGVLKVEGPEGMLTMVRGGIGPAKAFGCGLLSLAPG